MLVPPLSTPADGSPTIPGGCAALLVANHNLDPIGVADGAESRDHRAAVVDARLERLDGLAAEVLELDGDRVLGRFEPVAGEGLGAGVVVAACGRRVDQAHAD